MLRGTKDQGKKFSTLYKTEPKNSGTGSSSENAHPRDTDQQQILTDCVYVPLLFNALTNTQSPAQLGKLIIILIGGGELVFFLLFCII